MDTFKYFVYTRKSSEPDDKQALSIPSQISALDTLIKTANLNIVGPAFEESKSAKAPGRPIFDDMISKIEKGEANAILAWHVDRLSRNSVDTGRLIYLMDQGKLKEIRTPSQIYRNTPNDKFMINIFCGAAKLENDNKGVNVKRGLDKKASMGWFPACLPIGYVNDLNGKKGFKEIKPDPERYDLIRKMFDLMLSGNYSPSHIRDIAVNQWGLTAKRGTKFSRSSVYNLFSNSFYYGSYEYPKGTGNWHQGKHQPMITTDEYDRIQALLGRKGKPRSKKYFFAFSGLIYCGECGATVTCEEKTQVICPKCRFKFSYKTRKICPKCNTAIEDMRKPTFLKYVYYHCSKKIKPTCTQGCIEEKVLEKQVRDILSRIEIPWGFHDWAMKHIKIDNKEEAEGRDKILASHRKRLTELIKGLDRLIDLRVKDEITEEEFINKKSTYSQEINKLREICEGAYENAKKWYDAAEQIFTFARDAKTKFENGSVTDKRQILQALGSNLTLKDKTLTVKIEKPLVLIEKISQEVKSISGGFEPNKDPQKSSSFGMSEAACLKILRR